MEKKDSLVGRKDNEYNKLDTNENEESSIEKSSVESKKNDFELNMGVAEAEATSLTKNPSVKKKKERVYWVDALRIYACYTVILTHVTTHFTTKEEVSSPYIQKLQRVYLCLARTCVPLFVMISGIFFLNPNKVITIKQIFTRYVYRILKHFIFWSLYYNIIEELIIYREPNTKINKDTIVYTIARIILGDGHALWYLNFTIGLYISTPLIKQFTQSKTLTIYAIIIFTITSQFVPTFYLYFTKVHPVKDLPDIVKGYNNGLYFEVAGSFETYYLLGYLLSSTKFKKNIYNYIFYVFGVIGAYSTVKLYKYHHGFADMDRFNVAIYTAGTFVFFKEVVSRLLKPILKIDFLKKLLLSISECSFGMYLIHMVFLRAYAKNGLTLGLFNVFFWPPLKALIVFISCYITIYLLRKIPILREVI